MERLVDQLAAGVAVWLACALPINVTGANSGMERDLHSHFSGFLITAL